MALATILGRFQEKQKKNSNLFLLRFLLFLEGTRAKVVGDFVPLPTMDIKSDKVVPDANDEEEDVSSGLLRLWLASDVDPLGWSFHRGGSILVDVVVSSSLCVISSVKTNTDTVNPRHKYKRRHSFPPSPLLTQSIHRVRTMYEDNYVTRNPNRLLTILKSIVTYSVHCLYHVHGIW